MTRDTSENIWNEANKLWDAGCLEEAYLLLLKAAKAGEKISFNSIGYFLDHGIGVEKDPIAARHWYRKSAKAKDKIGCSNLALCYRNSGNFRWAWFWYERAFSYGDYDAALELGRLLLTRKSSPEEKNTATEYLSLAMQSNYFDAKEKKKIKELLRLLEKR
jgi:TPR repeat protein